MTNMTRSCAAVAAVVAGLSGLLGGPSLARADLDAASQRRAEVGTASWYGPRFHGRPTASGERFDQDALTAAHKQLPLGTIARVTNLANGRQVVVEINDRGPFKGRRVIDLSRAAAHRLNMAESGLARVRIDVLRMPDQDPLPEPDPLGVPAF
jgi:rare lipoprotein A